MLLFINKDTTIQIVILYINKSQRLFEEISAGDDQALFIIKYFEVVLKVSYFKAEHTINSRQLCTYLKFICKPLMNSLMNAY